MLKENRIGSFFLLLTVILLSIKITSSERITNCQMYLTEGNNEICSRCMYGYAMDYKAQCNPKIFVRVVSIFMAVKYMEPFVSFRNIFCDFMGDFWFLASNQSHSHVSRELTQLMIAINNERLWPFGIKEKFQILVGQQRVNKFNDFMGLKINKSQRYLLSIKRDLFIFEKTQFSFTSFCGIRLLCSLTISLAVWFGLQLIEGIVYFLTQKRIFEKRSIKGNLLTMSVGQSYHFVGFYGFYQLRNLQGYGKFGMKLNIAVTVLILFLFAFISITILPIIYYINRTKSQNESSTQSIQSQTRIANKVHRVLSFANTPQALTYYLINGPFRNFTLGGIIGYFYDGSNQYVILALWYGVEFLLLEDIGSSLSSKIYFLLRKGYILMNIIFIALLYQENAHVFSDPYYSFMPIQEICLCFLYVLSITQFLLQFTELLWIFLSSIKKWLKIKNKVFNAGPLKNAKQKSTKRKLMRQPSIAERVLTTQKTLPNY